MGSQGMRFSDTVFALSTLIAVCASPLSSQSTAETEPNDSPFSANVAVLGTTVTGHVGNPDFSDSVDYWKVTVAATETIYVSVESCGLCVYGGLDVTLLEAAGGVIQPSRVWWDGGDPQITFIAPTSGTFFLRAQSNGYSDVLTYALHLFERSCPEDGTEPNDSLGSAHPIALGSMVPSSWCPSGDTDLFSVQLNAGNTLEFALGIDVKENYFGNQRVLLRGSSGERLDNHVVQDGPVSRFVAPRTGTYYLQPSSYRGGIKWGYELQVGSPDQLPQGPGDPASPIAEGVPLSSVLVSDRQGNLWMGSNSAGLLRIGSDGSRTEFSPGQFFSPRALSWDEYGNLLVMVADGVRRFAAPGRYQYWIDFFQRNNTGGGLAIGRDAIWVSDIGTKSLYRYGRDRKLQATYNVAQVFGAGPFKIALGPSGDPYFSAGNSIYRLVNGVPQLILQHEPFATISDFAFDSAGQIYVADQVTTTDSNTVVVGTSRLALHDSSGALRTRVFSTAPRSPGALAFGRNSDGTPSNRLYVLDRFRLLELNPKGVASAGLRKDFTASCPVDASEREPNNTAEAARALSIDSVATGLSCGVGDEDYFRVVAPLTVPVEFETVGASDQYTMLELLAEDGHTRLGFSDHPNQLAQRVPYVIEQGKAYYLHVRSWFAGEQPYTVRTLLAKPADLTRSRAALELARPGQILSAGERLYIDRTGNNNGRFDIGDLRLLIWKGIL